MGRILMPWAKPAPVPSGEPILSPEVKANPLSKALFSWCTGLLKVGYTRILVAEDLPRLDPPRLAQNTGTSLEKNFYARVPPSRRPHFLRPEGYVPPARHESSVREKYSDGRDGGGDAEEKMEQLVEKSGSTENNGTMELQILSLPSSSIGPTLPLPIPALSKPTPALKLLSTTNTTPPARLSAVERRKYRKKFPGNEEGGKVQEDGVAFDQSLVMALNRTFIWPFWTSAIFFVCSSVLQATAPLLTRRLLNFLESSYAYSTSTPTEIVAQGLVLPSVGTGIGLGFGIFVMQEVASLCQNQYQARGMTTGFLMRSSLITIISRKTLRLSGSSRVKHPNGQLVTLVSSDASFLDWSAVAVHGLWVYPLTIAIGVALLIVTLGYSALVGVAILLVNTPLQTMFVRRMVNTRRKYLKIVDQRVRLLQEVLNGIRVVKLYAYEAFFRHRIVNLRSQELLRLRTIAVTRAGMTASMGFVPIAAAVLSFITYSLSGHELSAAIIFSSLQLFNVIKQPLTQLPIAFTLSSDAYVALGRIQTALLAEELETELNIDPKAPDAIRAFGDFAWESSAPPSSVMRRGGGGGGGRRGGGRDKEVEKRKKERRLKMLSEEKEDIAREKKGLPPIVRDDGSKLRGDGKRPFEVKDVDIQIPRGSLTCIVGTVGSGKSSLLQALIGEMKKLRGDVTFGGSTAYVPQSAWVQNCSLRENLLFGQMPDDRKLEEVIWSCALDPDIEMLPNGLETEIGEKGINLSGGQKARVSLARAVYFDADIIMLDDPLSAVDAHVTKHIVENCIVAGPLAAKTRILVTHHLDVLPLADHIIVMDHGRIAEQGTYADLLQGDLGFAKLIKDFGSMQSREQAAVAEDDAEDKTKPERVRKVHAKGPKGAALMQEEDRATGSVSWAVYTHYARSMGSVFWAPILFSVYAMIVVCTVGNNVFLGFWSAQSIGGFQQGDYMAIYASFGIASGIFSFTGTFLMYLRGITASYAIFNEALEGVIRSRISFFDTTPIGRIVSRMSRDITTLDNQLPMQWNMLLNLVFQILGTVGLVIYTFPLLGVIFIPMLVIYYFSASFYRASSREVKRIDSVLRSYIYTNYGEMLYGMASIRAYRAQDLFLRKTEHSIDVENRAYFMTIHLQRWLGVRLDFLGNILVLGIALFGVGYRHTINPSKLGVVLTYSLSVTSVFSQLVSNFANVEQDMNTAERVTHYGKLPSEAPTETANDPPATWPDRGCIEFKDVKMAYRDGLPNVLRGVSFSTRPGEKVGIVGRTGAGKSSLLQALFRIVEIGEGSIVIDGYDTKTIGLDCLRKRMAVIPQDALLYAGTVRENLDPTGEKEDAVLNDALRRAGLVTPPNANDEVVARYSKFKLDANVTDEGSNFSAGERQLVALCRALVKNSRVIVLDEATSSVDVETDASVQRAIQTEFSENSLLCIAHRLATIAFYDRVLVMDQGIVAEFDEPLVLFDRTESVFRGMCDKAHLSREDIVRIRRMAGKDDELREVRLD